MEITSHLLTNDEIGVMHVVRMRPDPEAFKFGSMIVCNSLAGRITTPDGFGLPYSLAQRGYDTLYVEFPGSGHSPMPEDSKLRRDYVKHGVIALGDPVAELIDANAEQLMVTDMAITLGGFSLGGIRAATLLPHFRSRVGTFFTSESAGYGTSANIRNMRRYKNHLSQSGTAMLEANESTDIFYSDTAGNQQEFLSKFHSLFRSRAVNKIAGAVELRGIYDSMNGHILKIMTRVLIDLVTSGKSFELRAGFVKNAYALDAKAVEDANTILDQMDEVIVEADAQHRVRMGFLQGGWFGDWHEQAVKPDRIYRLLQEPMRNLSNRLAHMYMP